MFGCCKDAAARAVHQLALRILIPRGPVTFRVGTAVDLDDLVLIRLKTGNSGHVGANVLWRLVQRALVFHNQFLTREGEIAAVVVSARRSNLVVRFDPGQPGILNQESQSGFLR